MRARGTNQLSYMLSKAGGERGATLGKRWVEAHLAELPLTSSAASPIGARVCGVAHCAGCSIGCSSSQADSWLRRAGALRSQTELCRLLQGAGEARARSRAFWSGAGGGGRGFDSPLSPFLFLASSSSSSSLLFLPFFSSPFLLPPFLVPPCPRFCLFVWCGLFGGVCGVGWVGLCGCCVWGVVELGWVLWVWFVWWCLCFVCGCGGLVGWFRAACVCVFCAGVSRLLLWRVLSDRKRRDSEEGTERGCSPSKAARVP